ncbi:hypothetical protein KKH27_00380 [bacterium]|nr:hypothetical protein [bacterium]MBU1983327.1 hypothetical protein [bacterium]
MRLRALLVMTAALLWAASASAQFRGTSPSGDTGEYLRNRTDLGLKPFRGLLDPSRIHMSHSVQLGYASVGDRSGSQGLYMNRIDYQISRPLGLTTYLGYQFQPSGPAEWNPAKYGNEFVGGADLNWRPTSNSLFRLSVYRGMYPYSHSYYGDYGWRAPGLPGYGSYLDRP